MQSAGARPRARRQALVACAVGRETIVYDRRTHTAHCLNPVLSVVWKHCDGCHTVSQIATILKSTAGVRIGLEAVQAGIEELGRVGLLEGLRAEAAAVHSRGRRRLLKQLGAASAALITSMVVPPPAAAASCLPNGALCVTNAQCCSGQCQPADGAMRCQA